MVSPATVIVFKMSLKRKPYMISLGIKSVYILKALLITDCIYGNAFTKAIPKLLIKKVPKRDLDRLIGPFKLSVGLGMVNCKH